MPRTPHTDLLANLVAAVSVIEEAHRNGTEPKLVAGSDTIFKMMLADYNGAIGRGREHMRKLDLAEAEPANQSWLVFAVTAPSDRSSFTLLDDLLSMPTATDSVSVQNAFLAEATDLGLEVNRFHYLRAKVEKARLDHVEAGGTFGEFRNGAFHEPVTTAFMEEVIDRQMLFRLHVLTMLDGRQAARDAKVAKDAAKAAAKEMKAQERAIQAEAAVKK